MSFTHQWQLRVRYGETDQMGFVYYGVYAQYYEVGRVEALRSLGIRYADIERQYHIWLPVMSMQVRYLRPARYDDLLTITTQIPELPNRAIRFRYEIHNEEGVLLNGAVVELCFLDAASQKRVDAPPFILDPLLPYFVTP
jgi:acyl-CoA thioester hydrolase